MTRTNAQQDPLINALLAWRTARLDPKDVAIDAALASLTARVAALEAPAVVVPPLLPPSFLSYPASGGPLDFVSAHDVEVTAKSFRAIGGTRSALRFEGVVNLWVHDCDFADFAASVGPAILCLSCKGSVIIERCRFRESGRNAVQFDKTVASGVIRGCRVQGGSGFEDVISMYASGGTGPGDLFVIEDNAIEVGNWISGSGSGLMLADQGGGHIVARRNTLLNPGQVGVGISGGVDIHVIDNIIYGMQRPGSNVGIYTPYVAGVPNPGGHEAARNRVFWRNAAGAPNPAWDGGASGPIAGWTTNIWQDATINPAALAVVL